MISNSLTGEERLTRYGWFASGNGSDRIAYLYALKRAGEILYVGQTIVPRNRFNLHNSPRNSHLGSDAAGSEFVLLRICRVSEALRLESQVIQALRKRGQCRLNTIASISLLPVHHFEFRGKTYRLFKRVDESAAPWYFQIKRAGKRFVSSTKTPVVATAIAKAKALLEASERQQLAAVRAILNPQVSKVAYCTMGELLEVFDKTPLDIGDKHRTGIRSAISVVLRTATGADDITKLSTWIVNPDTARRYFEAMLLKAQAQPDQAGAGQVKRSANSTWCQAVCLLRPKLIAAYERAGLRLPDVQPFLDIFEQEKFSKCATVYNPPAETVIRNTLRDWLKLKDRNMFLAVGLELSCGLRRSEVAQVTWSMLTTRNGAPLLDGSMTVKNQTGRLTVQPIDPFWRLLMRRIKREGWRGADLDLVLIGTKTDLAEDIWRDIGAWLRGLGWRTEKTNHALRAFAGCQVAMRFDCYRAQCWLRHRSVTTTQSDYGHFLKSAVYTPDKVRIRWAK